MNILLVHQNYPAQFLHLGPALRARGHNVLALTDSGNTRNTSVPTVRYKPVEPRPKSIGIGAHYAGYAQRGLMAARGALVLRDKHRFTPDVIFGHSGWGETLFLREVWPEARLLIYAELMYRTTGQDTGFDPEISRNTDLSRIGTVARSAHLVQSIVQADAGLSPTYYQANSFPPDVRQKITVIHDGVATDQLQPDPSATLTLPDGRVLSAGQEIVTYVARSLEPYRGFHRFMRALPRLLQERPEAQVVIIGTEKGVSYGAPLPDGQEWKDKMLSELDGQLDLSRVHFLGRVPYAQFVKTLQVSKAHVYLTFPFVLSWSLIEAMALGCYIIGSDTAPVREVIADGETGRLVSFHDADALCNAMVRRLSDADPKADDIRRKARSLAIERYDLRRACLPRLIRFVESGGRES